MRPDMWRWKHTMRDVATGFHIMRKRPEDHERSFTAWKKMADLASFSGKPVMVLVSENICISQQTHTHAHEHACNTHTLMCGCHIALLCWHRWLSRKTSPFPWDTSQFHYLLFHSWELLCQDLFNLWKARENTITKALWFLEYALDLRTYDVSPRRT